MTSFGAIEMVYPVSPDNEWMAERLKKELLSYRIPAAVQKKTGIRDLSEMKTPALIVFCMPESVKDPEVEAAIERFRASDRSNRIIALILDGAPGERFPEGLLHETLPDGTTVDREPLAANISAPTRKEKLKKLETEKLRIIASVLGVAFDDLKNRRKRRRMRIAAAAGAVLFVFAAAFLGYALSRVRVMTGQQEELSGQYAEAQEAEREAELQRNAAKEAFAGTIASEAGKVLDSGDSELALLLCLELLPEMRNVDLLTEVFRDSLSGLCAEGYVPVTEEGPYTRSRYGLTPRQFLDKQEQMTEPAGDQFEDSIYPPLPEEAESEEDYIELKREAFSVEESCAFYVGKFKTPDGRSIFCGKIHFPDHPEKDYYLKDRQGAHLRLEKAVFLPDGTFLGVGYKDKLAYRVRIADGEILPFFDEEAEGIQETDTGGTVLPIHVTAFQYFEGTDAVFGTAASAVEAYGLRPFRYSGILEGVWSLEEQKETAYLFGLCNSELKVYTKTPFAECCVLKAEADYISSSSLKAVELPDGKEIVRYLGSFYELPEGKLLYSFKKYDFGRIINLEDDISSEGWVPVQLLNETIFWDVRSGKEAGRIPVPYDPAIINRPSYGKFYGPYDEREHRRSASAFNRNGVVWEYRESAREVPEKLEDQIALAEELLQGRTLTKRERAQYHLLTPAS